MSSVTTGIPSSSSFPPCRVLVRSKHAVELYTVASTTTTTSSSPLSKIILLDQTKPCTSTIPICNAPDGSFALIHVQNLGIVKCDLKNNTVNQNFFPPSATTSVQMMHLSPLGNYLVTWEKYSTTTNAKNLKLWCVHTGRLMTSFVQKSLSRESWPYLQFTHDELYGCLVINNAQIRIYNVQQDIIPLLTSNLSNAETEPRYCSKLQVPCTTLSVQYHSAMTSQLLQPETPTVTSTTYYFTTFVGKTKDKPAVASIYSYTPPAVDTMNDATKSTTTVEEFTRCATKSLFQAEECNTKWSPSISIPSCLLTLSVAIDATGQSYYGNSQLYLWNHSNSGSSANHKSSGDALIAVPLPQDGPVLSCQWIPDPNKPLSFIVIAGKIPPMTSHHHGMTGDVTFLYGNNVSRNTIIPSPHGRFVCTAGFGNMPGGMSFWDINKKKLIPHSYANAQNTLKSDTPVTVYSWSPDSRYFLTATTAPRMNVENGIHLYKYTGELITSTNHDLSTIIPWNNKEYQPNHLYEAIFVPALLHVYPDRPQSPVPEGHNSTDTALSSAASSTAAPTTAPAKSTAYVPPSARRAMGNGGNGTSLAERLRREKEGTVQGATKVVNASTINANKSSVGTNRVIPGLTQAAATKTKSQMKREKLKQKLEQQQSTPTTESSTATTTVAAAPVPVATSKAESVTEVTAVVTVDMNNSVEVEKRVKKLKKILKQIEDLKLLTVDLNDDQKAKVASESKIVSELKDLGA